MEEPQIILWDAQEYHHVERNADWFWMLGIIAVCAAILCIIFDDVLFALFILLGALAAGLYAAREPSIAHYELQPKGILADTVFYPYRELDSFWIDEHHELPRILLKSKKVYMTHIIVTHDHTQAEEIKGYLLNYLPEVEHHETTAHRILERIGL